MTPLRETRVPVGTSLLDEALARNVVKVEFLQDPAVLTDYNFNLQQELLQYQARQYRDNVIGYVRKGLELFINESGGVSMAPGHASYSGFFYENAASLQVSNFMGEQVRKFYLEFTETRVESDTDPANLTYTVSSPQGNVVLETHNEYRLTVTVVSRAENSPPTPADDGVTRTVYLELGTVSFGFATVDTEVVNRPLLATDMFNTVYSHDRIFRAIVNEEDIVVLDGLEVSTFGSDYIISEGSILTNNQYVYVERYRGPVPVILSSEGEWLSELPNDPPGLGDLPVYYTTFDPETSQRFQDVLRRAIVTVGEIKMFKARASEFDSTGLGRWAFKGFAIANGENGTVDLRGRFPVGYDPTDSDYNAPGAQSGAKTVTLTPEQMPAHTHSINDPGHNHNEGTYDKLLRTSTGGNDTVALHDETQGEVDVKTSRQIQEADTGITLNQSGGSQAHENRPPYHVVVMVERIAL